MSEDAELLRRYAAEGAETAFAELVRRRIDLVYAVALRRVGGDAHLAQDVTQGVFTDLARKAKSLTGHPSVSAWLFRSARFAAAQAMRAELRRMNRETEAHMMHESTNRPDADANSAQLRRIVDEVLEDLPERDRVAVWLRFYEGKPFAEIGARLSASEDAVRVRVDRALEKMRGSLALRGIGSTTAALTSALAREGGALAPAGLAASVTGAALAGAAAGAGVAAGVGLTSFMSTIKIAGWTVAGALLLASLAGNAYLLTRKKSSTVAPEVAGSHAVGVGSSAAPAVAAASSALELVRGADLAGLRDQLRAAGTAESSIRGVLEGILRRRYREKLSAERADRMHRGWWRDLQGMQRFDNPMRNSDDGWLLRTMVTVPLEQLLGPDPLALAEADAKYAFLPSELRQAFGKLDRDLPAGRAATGDVESDATMQDEITRQRAEVERKRQELIASLTPEQRTAWEMRTGTVATALSRQLELVEPTEAEFLAVFPIAERYAKARAERLPEGSDFASARLAIEQRTMDQLVTTLGYDRALDYIWAGAIEYASFARVARDASMPASTAARVTQLAAETGLAAAGIHRDAALSVEQKRAALLALQQQTRTSLDTLMPPAVQQRIAPSAMTWFTALGTGGYKTVPPTLPGGTGITISMVQSVDGATPPAAPLRLALPQRPPTN